MTKKKLKEATPTPGQATLATPPVDPNGTNTYGLSDGYWATLNEKSKALYAAIRPLTRATWSCNFFVKNIERDIVQWGEEASRFGGTFDLNPDFQRGHVWSPDKQQAFIEAMIRGLAPMVIRFNNPSYGERRKDGDINPHDMVCIDGLQRVTAMRKFVAGEVRPFGHDIKDFDGTDFDQMRMKYAFTLEMYTFAFRKDLLTFYIDLNAGGVVHTAEEIERVRKLRDGA